MEFDCQGHDGAGVNRTLHGGFFTAVRSSTEMGILCCRLIAVDCSARVFGHGDGRSPSRRDCGVVGV